MMGVIQNNGLYCTLIFLKKIFLDFQGGTGWWRAGLVSLGKWKGVRMGDKDGC